ncbi:MAG: hypothetical protein CM1200mP38_8500 [Dehalococcoidia bacterium]|nr:MAG: hypothetical protein CM1200mP38_8500 [Dehalococcoidia bacterium]
MVLSDHPDVITESEGFGSDRQVVFKQITGGKYGPHTYSVNRNILGHWLLRGFRFYCKKQIRQFKNIC